MKKQKMAMLLDSSVGELHFSNLCVRHLLSVIEEIVAVSDDPIVKKIAINGTERHTIDKIVHAKKLFYSLND